MAGVKAFSGAAAAVLLMTYVGLTPALADTIETLAQRIESLAAGMEAA